MLTLIGESLSENTIANVLYIVYAHMYVCLFAWNYCSLCKFKMSPFKFFTIVEMSMIK